VPPIGHGIFGGYTTAKGAMLDLHDSGLESVPADQAAAAIDDPGSG